MDHPLTFPLISSVNSSPRSVDAVQYYYLYFPLMQSILLEKLIGQPLLSFDYYMHIKLTFHSHVQLLHNSPMKRDTQSE